MTREEIAAIDRECEEQHISQQEYLDSHGIAKHQYYRWKRKYREEDEQSLVPAGFVPMMPGTMIIRQISGQIILFSFASQVFVRIEIKHFLPIEFLRLPAVSINLVV